MTAEPIRILVFDDDQDMAILVKRLLERTLEARVDIAGDCSSARERIASSEYDVVTLDYRLPDGNGLEILKEIAATENHPEMVVLTGHGDEQTAVESFEQGAVGYVMKDKKMRTLLPAAVEKALSERRRKEAEALGESDATYHEIFDKANDAIFVHDTETGNILDVNLKMCEMYGYSRDEALRLNVADLSSDEPPYTQEEALRWLRRAADGEPQLFEWRAREKTGRLFWVEVNLKQATIAGKARLLAIVRDITRRKKTEEALKEFGDLLDSIFEQSAACICISNSEGTLIKQNQACRDLFGIREGEQTVGVYNIFEDNVLEEQGFLPLVEDVFKKGERARFTTDYDITRVEHFRGLLDHEKAKPKTLEFTISPVKNAEGEVTNAVIQHRCVNRRNGTDEAS